MDGNGFNSGEVYIGLIINEIVVVDVSGFGCLHIKNLRVTETRRFDVQKESVTRYQGLIAGQYASLMAFTADRCFFT